jgi:hypothetical protein
MTTETQQTNETGADAVEDTALGTAAAAEDTSGADKTAATDKADQKADDTDKAGDKTEASGEKKDEKVEAPEGAPEKYDTAAFKMPEGIEFDTEGFEAVEPTLRDLNLSQDQAGKLMTAYAEKIVPRIQEQTLKAMDDNAAELRANLARDLQTDPEVGGKKLEESRSLAAKAIAHFIPDKNERSEFSTFLNESGLGNQKHLMRIVAGAGKILSEATTAAGQHASGPATDSQLFYGKKG